MITVVLRGEPQGKGRPRSRIATGRGGKQFIAVYTPAATRAYENAVALAAKVAMGSRLPLDGPLMATVTAIMGIPRSWPKKRQDAALVGSVRPTTSPDGDNLLKSALDGLNGIVFQDDKQVVDARVVKFYGAEPMLKVTIEPAAATGGLL